jgi:hypothetical protein
VQNKICIKELNNIISSGWKAVDRKQMLQEKKLRIDTYALYTILEVGGIAK